MSGSDNSMRPGSPTFRQMGVGMAATFKCGDCDKSASTIGRRMRKVRGLRTYVCAGCVRKVAAS